MESLNDIHARICEATKALERACAGRWPKGSRVQWIRRHGQKIPSEGTVIWHSGGDVGVQYESVHRYRGARTRCKRVEWTRIIT